MSADERDLRNAILQAQVGDAQALGFIVKHFGYIVEAMCARMEIEGAAEISRSDLSQEVWLRVWCQIHTFKCNNDSNLIDPTFRSWLKATAKNVILSIGEKRRAQKRGGAVNWSHIQHSELVSEESKTASGIAARNEELTRMTHAINDLPATDAQIVNMRYREGKTLHEIAEATSLTLEQVRYRLTKALNRIEQAMG